MIKKFVFIALISGYGLSGLWAQQMHTIPATGGKATGSGGSVSYSIGQLFYQSTFGTDGSVVEGVQQPFEISEVISGIKDIYGIDLISTIPNPARDFLILKVGNIELTDFSFQLFNISGIIIKTEKITEKETSIYMTSLKPSTYLLKVYAGNQEIKTFKIIKN